MERYDCDVLVIGGGAAASRAAYEAKKLHPKLNVLMAYVLFGSLTTNLP